MPKKINSSVNEEDDNLDLDDDLDNNDDDLNDDDENEEEGKSNEDSGKGDEGSEKKGEGADDEGSEGAEGGEGSEETDVDEAEARERLREHRREERKARKLAQRAREDHMRSELAARDKQIESLTNRLNAVEQRGTVNEIQQIDQALLQLGNIYTDLKAQLEEGTTKQDGRLVADATEKMMLVRQRAERLAGTKQSIIQNHQRQSQLAPEPDPRVVNHGQGWMNKNKWYKHGSMDQDSKIVAAIDDTLSSEGWDPSQEDYWKELDVRVKRALPHRFTSRLPEPNIRDKTPHPKQVVAGSSRSASGQRQSGFILSPERKQAMMDAGQWDDPAKRKSMIEKYRQYDREHKGKEY
jgi:hypothetical protein